MRKKGKGGKWERESDMGTAALVSPLPPFPFFRFLHLTPDRWTVTNFESPVDSVHTYIVRLSRGRLLA